jgi:hypothetical protein
MHVQAAMGYLHRLECQDITSRVGAIIVKELSSGLVSKIQVADKFCMSTRNLELKLAEENTNFQKIAESIRRALAEGSFEQSSIVITEIAYLLVFLTMRTLPGHSSDVPGSRLSASAETLDWSTDPAGT